MFRLKYFSPATTLAVGQESSGACDASGNLMVNIAGNSATVNTNVNTGALVTLTAASAGVASADQTNLYGTGIKIVINITAMTGTSPTLTVTLQGKDPVSGVYYTILASTAIAATGTTVLTVFPGLATTANVSANDILPYNWRINTVIGGTTPAVTATVSATVID